MNRIDRLFAILLRISDGRLFRAEDLALEFELSDRTIYRDISALLQMGVPIRSEAGVGYQLESGFFMPPLLFTREEALASGLALKFLVTSTTGKLQEWANNTFKKINSAMPRNLKEQIHFDLQLLEYMPPSTPIPFGDHRFIAVMTALREQRLLEIEYFSFGRSVSEHRQIEPIKLFLAPGQNIWYLDAFCRTRNAWRSFRLDRMVTIKSTTLKFRSRDHDTMFGLVRAPDSSVATLFVRTANARWIRERQHWTFSEESPYSEDTITMTYRNFEENQFIGWLLSVSDWIDRLEPEEIRTSLRKKLSTIETLLT